jgi:hypothetical protein
MYWIDNFERGADVRNKLRISRLFPAKGVTNLIASLTLTYSSAMLFDSLASANTVFSLSCLALI